jgi:hypothetical protein
MRQALKVGRGVAISFRLDPPLTRTEQAELLQKLAEALDMQPDVDLAGCTVRWSPSSAVQGTLGTVSGNVWHRFREPLAPFQGAFGTVTGNLWHRFREHSVPSPWSRAL